MKAIFKGLLGAPTVPSALLTYGPNTPELFRSSVGYVDKILKGARPTDLPMQQPTTFELSINFHAAQRLGIAIPRRSMHAQTKRSNDRPLTAKSLGLLFHHRARPRWRMME